MYNRYIRTDRGVYTRIPQEEPQTPHVPPKEPPHREEQASFFSEKGKNSEQISDGITGFLRHILDQLHLNHVDTGDLLLLLLLFLLFREDADEELLVALGLLLIL